MASNAPPAGLPDLEALARARFPDLKPAEVKLVRAAPKGEFAVCGPSGEFDDPTNDPSKANEWGPDREIRADVIRWLCVDRQARELVDPKGIQILGARITGPLDLGHVGVPFQICLWRCRLLEDVNLRNMEASELDLQGSWTRSISADRVRVRGSIFLRNGFRAEGVVRLPGAQIGGELDCSAGTLINPSKEGLESSGVALHADRVDVKGSVFLRNGFHAEGAVRLLGAQIGGQLACVGGTLHNPPEKGLKPSGVALIADQIDVKGGVFLNDGFHAEGTVRLPGARSGGQLNCEGGAFTHPSQAGPGATATAIIANGIDVKGSVFLRGGFCAEGAVSLSGAQIGGNLECSVATFHGACNAQSATVKGTLFWTNISDPRESNLNLTNASVDAIVDDKRSWPGPGKLILDGLVYGRFSEGPKDADSRLDWLDRQKEFRPQPYRQLGKVLREEGDYAGARKVLFELEKERRAEEDKESKKLERSAKSNRDKFRSLLSRILLRAWDQILRHSIGYGYYPERAVNWLIVLVLLGFVLLWGAFIAGGIAPTDKDVYAAVKKGATLPPFYEEFHASIYSLENSAPLVKLGQVERWQPDPDPQWRSRLTESWSPLTRTILSPRFLRWFLWGQTCLGWILATFFVAGVTGIVRKE